MSKQVRIGLVALLPVILFIGYGLLRYGTASPCGMLKKNWLAQVASTSDVPAGLGLLSVVVADQLIESHLASRGPVECLVALGTGEGPLDAVEDGVFDIGLGRDEDFFGPSLIGQPAPTWRLETLDGDSLSLDDLRGKVVLLNFWASWLGSMEAEHAILVRAAAAWPEEGMQVVGVVFGDSRRNAQRFVDQHGGDWKHVMDPGDETAIDYGVHSVPQSFFIDRDGIVGMTHIGPLTWNAAKSNVESLLATAADPRR